MASVRASAARSASVKYGASRQAATVASRSSLSPAFLAPAEPVATSLTAEPLDLDYKHEIIRRVHQERDQAPAVRAEMQ